MEKIFQIWKVVELRKKILFILGMLVVYRLAANVPLPGVDISRVAEFLQSSQLFGMLNIFSGGGLSNISIMLLGVGPYITASIIMQLLTMIVPQLEQLYKEEGEAGRQKFTMITRVLAVPLATVQTFAMISLLRNQGIIGEMGGFDVAVMVAVATAGTILLMWLGELMTEKGIGNGVSLIIFAGIVSSLPSMVGQLFTTFDSANIYTYLIFLVLGLITIAGVVFVNEGQRNIPIAYAKRVRGARVFGGTTTHLPLRVNQAGVIPIIFAVSIILFPPTIASFFAQSSNASIASTATTIANFFQNQWVYGFLYFFLVMVFTYFYTAVVFDPKKISENLQKQGGYIPGIRPGKHTMEYLGKITSRITLAGSIFLGAIAVLPLIVQGFLTAQGVSGASSLAIGGTSILIVVSVVIEIIKQVEGQMVMRSYDSY